MVRTPLGWRDHRYSHAQGRVCGYIVDSICPTGVTFMNPIALLLLAFAMSTDAFAAAIGRGASLKNPRLVEAFRIGLIFGSIEAVTPL